MEDILVVYKRPRDEDCPLVCLDEASKQLLADTRSPIPMKPGQPERGDYEYKRNGTANLFMMFAPLDGWRHIEITNRRTAIDYAHALEALSDTHFKNAKKIVLCRTISIPTNLPRFMKHSCRTKQGGLSNASNGITRPSTAAG
jgi:DDE superfamily endonuclease